MCPICQRLPQALGVLCDPCRAVLGTPFPIMPEQIVMHGQAATAAVLVDRWGRQHPLDPDTMIGRDVTAHGLAIVEPSVSRQHARVTRRDSNWVITDVGSSNGTFVANRAIEHPVALSKGAHVRIGEIGFFFLEDASNLPAVRFPRAISETFPLDLTAPKTAVTRELDVPALARLSVVTISLHEPTGGGGGLVYIDGKSVQLTVAQYELVSLMVRRMLEEEGLDDHVRGFIDPAELLARLPLECTAPGDDNVRQLIRRVRRAFLRAEIMDPIESRYGVGYRLRVIPVVT